MGWKGYETEIPIGMIFRKMYCHKCSAQLKREKTTNVYKKGESGYSNKILGNTTIGMTEIAKTHYIYRCPNCNSEISYDAQCIVSKKQKQLKQKIICEKDLDLQKNKQH